jgi:hypothetical protein
VAIRLDLVRPCGKVLPLFLVSVLRGCAEVVYVGGFCIVFLCKVLL